MRGRLKIFLGYAAGVGKTYAMLEAAQQRKLEGIDVAVAWIERQQFGETLRLLREFEKIGGASDATEMDVDAVLRRQPQLALVDELAHRNPAGLRHQSRVQDVEELLEAGIDVYTTLNIQNVESLTDIVQQITGLRVDEIVPDSMLDEADELELVDLPAEELMQRLREGKLRLPVVDAFFRKGNLTALREMAMRRAALRVDDQMRGYMADQHIAGPWPAGERVMVALSSHPLGDRLVRAGRRLADSLNAEWFVVFVETPGHLRMKSEQRLRLLSMLRSAEEMGARTMTLTGESVADTLVEFARKENITRLLVGRPPRPNWLEFFGGSLVDQILRRSGSIEVFVIGGMEGGPGPDIGPRLSLESNWTRYLASLGLAGLVTLLGLAFFNLIQAIDVVMFFLASVVVAGAFLGRGPAVFNAAISALAFAFFFTAPYNTFSIEDSSHLVTFLGLLVVGLVISGLSSLLRDQVRASRRREEEATALNGLSRDLTSALGLDEMLAAVIRNVSLTFGREATILMPEGERLVVKASSPELVLAPAAIEAVNWSFLHHKQCGRGTETFPGVDVRCLPLMTRDGVVGVLAVAPREAARLLSPEQRSLLEGFARLAALAIERARLSEQASQAAVLRTAERLQAALLNSISHDLRTPLATITGAVSSLLEAEQNQSRLDHAVRLDLLENAAGEAERLNLLVGNLLDMSRVEAGTMKVKLAPCDVQDVIGAALERAARRLGERAVETHIPEHLPAVKMDFVLMVQVLVNLLENAHKYSPPDVVIDMGAQVGAGLVEIWVADRGLGIPPEDLERVFEKFYRVQRPDGVLGTGLGLSICRGIVEAHGGQIHAENRPGGGTLLRVSLMNEA
jgi:two-component system sensor histidine kinase KdpD